MSSVQSVLQACQELVQQHPRETASILCGVFLVMGVTPYLNSIRTQKVQPNAAAWTIRTGLCVVSLAGQMADGATLSLTLAGTQLGCGLLIVALTLWRVGPGKLGLPDALAFSVVLIGAYFWWGYNSPMCGVVCVIIIDFMATVLGIRAMVVLRAKESVWLWLCCLLAASSAVISVGTANPRMLVAPLWSVTNALVVLCAISVVAIARRRHARKTAQQTRRRVTYLKIVPLIAPRTYLPIIPHMPASPGSPTAIVYDLPSLRKPQLAAA